MSLTLLKNVLLWSAALNYAVLMLWFLVFIGAHEWLQHLHRRWFKLAPEDFDRIHYAAMAGYKILILIFNLVPGLVLWGLG